MSEATYRLRNAIFRTFPLLDSNEQSEIVELKRENAIINTVFPKDTVFLGFGIFAVCYHRSRI